MNPESLADELKTAFPQMNEVLGQSNTIGIPNSYLIGEWLYNIIISYAGKCILCDGDISALCADCKKNSTV